MSSDIKEISKLKELLCRKKVSKIKSKYYKVEKKIYKKYIRDKEEDSEFLLKSSFIEFRKRYFNNLYTTINNIVDNSIGNLESDMLEYISKNLLERETLDEKEFNELMEKVKRERPSC